MLMHRINNVTSFCIHYFFENIKSVSEILSHELQGQEKSFARLSVLSTTIYLPTNPENMLTPHHPRIRNINTLWH